MGQVRQDKQNIFENFKNEPVKAIYSDDGKTSIARGVLIAEDKDFLFLQGDYSKSKRLLGYEPKVKFNELVKIMMEAEL